MTRSIISTTNAPAAIGPYSQAVKIGAFVFTSGQLGMDPASGALLDSIEEQAHQAFKNLSAILTEAGGGDPLGLRAACDRIGAGGLAARRRA